MCGKGQILQRLSAEDQPLPLLAGSIRHITGGQKISFYTCQTYRLLQVHGIVPGTALCCIKNLVLFFIQYIIHGSSG